MHSILVLSILGPVCIHHVDPFHISFSSNKENEKMADNHTDKNVKEVRSSSTKMLNGDSWVKEEVEEVSVDGEMIVVINNVKSVFLIISAPLYAGFISLLFMNSYIYILKYMCIILQEGLESGLLKNSDVDSLKRALSLQGGKLSQSDGDSNSSNPVAGSSTPPGPVSYISFLASEGIFPPTCSSKAGTTLLLSTPGNFVFGSFVCSREAGLGCHHALCLMILLILPSVTINQAAAIYMVPCHQNGPLAAVLALS